MVTDIRLLFSFKGHPKRSRLRKLLGPGYLDYLIDLWLTVAESRPDGILTGWDETYIACAAGYPDDPKTFVDALVECRLLDHVSATSQLTAELPAELPAELQKQQVPATWEIHDWAELQPWAKGSRWRSAKATINGLIGKYGREKGLKMAKFDRGINIEEFGYSIESNGSSYQSATSQLPAPATQLTPSPSPSPSPSPKRLEKDKESVSSETDSSPPAKRVIKLVPPCPVEEIIELYHTILPELPRIRTLGESGKKHLTARWKESNDRQNMEFWKWFFEERVKPSDFLMGRKKDWKADLLWLVGRDNFVKVLNAVYGMKGSRADKLPSRTNKNLAALEAYNQTLGGCGNE